MGNSSDSYSELGEDLPVIMEEDEGTTSKKKGMHFHLDTKNLFFDISVREGKAESEHERMAVNENDIEDKSDLDPSVSTKIVIDMRE